MPKLKVRRSRACSICYSPFRKEIEDLIRKEVPIVDIANKYYMVLNLKLPNCYNKLLRHIKNNHPPRIIDTTPTDPKEIVKPPEDYTIEELEKMLLKKVMTDPNAKVTASQAIAASRAVIEKKKLENSQNDIKLKFLQLMRGKPVVVEGEVLDEPRQITEGAGTDKN